MQYLTRPYGKLHFRIDGHEGAPAVVFANSLGTDLRLWDAVLPLLPADLRFVRYDKQGHGLSDLGSGDRLSDHVEDAAALIRALGSGPVTFVGLSIGGLIGQALASQQPELVRALVLSNTAARLGSAEMWQARRAAVQSQGMEAIAEAVLDRWFAPAFRKGPERTLWRNMLIRTPVDGYAAACAALGAADQTSATAALRLPCLVVAGAEDGASPPDLVAATASLIHGAACHVIPGVGHLPPVEAPQAFADLLRPFLKAHAYDR